MTINKSDLLDPSNFDDKRCDVIDVDSGYSQHQNGNLNTDWSNLAKVFEKSSNIMKKINTL